MSGAERAASMSPEELIAVIAAGLDEDERIAKAASGRGGPHWPNSDSETRSPQLEHARRHDPSRVLADVESKRAILARYERAAAAPDSASGFVRGQDDGYRQACLDALRDLARPYLDQETP